MSESRYGAFVDSFTKGGPIEFPNGVNVSGIVKSLQGNFIREDFNVEPISTAKAGAGAATGGTGDENLMRLNDSQFEYHILGTQTILSPTLGVGGLDINMDQTDDDGVEICLGINAANKGVFTVGTSGAFYTKMLFSIADVSGTDDCAFGFRKVSAYQAAIDDYDEMAILNVISGDITIETILNAGAATSTDTTNNFADGETHELGIFVSATGVVTYTIDGMPPATTAAFTFDDGEVVVPFMYLLNDSDVAGAVICKSFECGLQE